MRAERAFRRLCRILGGYERFVGERPKLEELPGGRRRIYLGDGRFDPLGRNAAYVREDGTVALNLQLNYVNDRIADYEIGVFWCGFAAAAPAAPAAPAVEFGLMYHRDAGRAAWPAHPERHVQFVIAAMRPPPFVGWRLPFKESPLRIVEYLVEQIAPRRHRPA